MDDFFSADLAPRCSDIIASVKVTTVDIYYLILIIFAFGHLVNLKRYRED
jgi:hypothetical protein